MEINRRIAELESVFPLAGVDDGYILSRSGDVTVGWELTIPTAFTVDRASYDAMLRSMASAIRALPDWTMVHRQDIYLDRTYRAEDRTAFLDSAYERHFDGRHYLEGRHYLYLTFAGKASSLRSTFSSGLFGTSMPRNLASPKDLVEFRARSEEFIAVATAGGLARARRLTDEDLIGPDGRGGLIEQVMTLGTGMLSDLSRRTRYMRQFSTDGANRANADENDLFKEDSGKEQLCAVHSHCNVICWGRSEQERLGIRSDVSAALSSMGVDAVRDIHSAPVLWYASLPGAETELSREHLMLTELHAALALAQYETFDNGLKRGALRLTDRLRHIPLTLDVQAEAEKANLVSNYNIFLDGASGTGKSFTTSSLLYNMYSYGEHVFIIDIGGSYEQVCAVVAEESGGRDGIYNRWDRAHPFSFCPFQSFRDWITDDGMVRRDDPSLNFLISLLMTLGTDSKKGIRLGDFEESIIVYLVTSFIEEWLEEEHPIRFPLFDDFVRWIRAFLIYGDDNPEKKGTMRPFLTKNGIRVESGAFSGEQFVESLSSYALDGQFGFLLNSEEPKDLFTSRFTVFDVGELSSVNNDKFYSLCVLCIVNAFDIKMRSKEIEGFKVMAIDEAWKAISNQTMAPYLRELWKTARKMSTSAMVITQELDDILTSDVIRETILQNSDIKILMSQEGNRNSFGKISGPLGLSQMDVNLIFSMAGKEKKSRDVFIKWGGGRSGVYTVEACPEQLWAFESNIQKKRPLMELTAESGSIFGAIRTLTDKGMLP